MTISRFDYNKSSLDSIQNFDNKKPKTPTGTILKIKNPAIDSAGAASLKEKQVSVLNPQVNEEDDFTPVEVKKEPVEPTVHKEVLTITKLKPKLALINPHFDPENEKGVENCLPVVISGYNLIITGSEYPEPVDPYAKSKFEHMAPINSTSFLLQDPHLENLHNPKTVHELDDEGNIKEIICLSDELPLTFKTILLSSLAKQIKDEVPCRQYEKGGKSFKVGILYLNHRDDESKAHFLLFYYYKSKINKKIEKDHIYIIDAQPNPPKCYTIEQFIKLFENSYTDEIKIWHGENAINFDCNKSVKEMFEPLIKQEKDEEETEKEETFEISTKSASNLKRSLAQENETGEIISSKKSKGLDSGSSDGPGSQYSLLKTAKLIEPFNPGLKNSPSDELVKQPEKTYLKNSNKDAGSKSLENLPEFEESVTEEEILDDNLTMEVFIRPEEKSINKEGISAPQNFEETLLLAKNGDPAAQCLIGQMYVRGLGVTKNYEEGFKYLNLAADKGNVIAMLIIALMYLDGAGVAQNDKEAFHYFKKVADEGSIYTEHTKAIVSYMYAVGKGVDQNSNEANKYGSFVSEASSDFLYTTGVIFLTKKGFQDTCQALHYFKLSAEKGNLEALVKLGDIYLLGLGKTPQNFPEAMKCYKIAADGGNPPAKAKLEGLTYLLEAINQTSSYAFELYKKSAAKGNPIAQNALGNIFFFGRGVDQDFNKALSYYKLSAQQGHAKAKASIDEFQKNSQVQAAHDFKMLGNLTAEQRRLDTKALLDLGDKFYSENKFYEAFKIYRLVCAKDENRPEVQYKLAYMCFHGEGVRVDFIMAFTYFDAAAKQGNINAQFYVGKCLSSGLGVIKNLKVAMECYKIAASQGHVEALFELGQIYEEAGTPNISFVYYKQAADKGHAKAQYKVGVAYNEGKGVPEDLKLAKHYSQLATAQGLAYAKEYLKKHFALM